MTWCPRLQSLQETNTKWLAYFQFFCILLLLLQGILRTVGTQGRVLMNLNERLNLFYMFYLFFQGLGSKLNQRR